MKDKIESESSSDSDENEIFCSKITEKCKQNFENGAFFDEEWPRESNITTPKPSVENVLQMIRTTFAAGRLMECDRLNEVTQNAISTILAMDRSQNSISNNSILRHGGSTYQPPINIVSPTPQMRTDPRIRDPRLIQRPTSSTMKTPMNYFVQQKPIAIPDIRQKVPTNLPINRRRISIAEYRRKDPSCIHDEQTQANDEEINENTPNSDLNSNTTTPEPSFSPTVSENSTGQNKRSTDIPIEDEEDLTASITTENNKSKLNDTSEIVDKIDSTGTTIHKENMVLNKQNLISEGKEVLITMENDDDDCDADSDLTEEFDCEEYNNSHKKNQNEYESLENGLEVPSPKYEIEVEAEKQTVAQADAQIENQIAENDFYYYSQCAELTKENVESLSKPLFNAIHLTKKCQVRLENIDHLIKKYVNDKQKSEPSVLLPPMREFNYEDLSPIELLSSSEDEHLGVHSSSIINTIYVSSDSD